jgi:glutamate-1-semialdehyde aminotransferase
MNRVHGKIPGGSHTYSKGDDQFPPTAPHTIARGEGYRLWDDEGRVFIDWTMGLASVSLGHAYPPVVEAAKAWLSRKQFCQADGAGRGTGRPVSVAGPLCADGQIRQARI